MKPFTKEEFIKRYQKVPVIEYNNNTCSDPLVSVCVATYQQEKFISECLDGILMQKTDFDFEIVLGEDNSTDGTRDICVEYAKKYPDKIKLFLHDNKNKIYIYDKPTGKFNIEYGLYKAKGKYLAICEGDDFWTDPLKLQKQIDFLEQNPDYGLIYGDSDFIDEKKSITRIDAMKDRTQRLSKINKSGNIFWKLLEKNVINTLTVCVRTELFLDYLYKFPDEEFSYDHRQWLHVASYTKIKYVNEKWATYRILDQGISRSDNFFNKRTPLAKQSALVHYMAIINYAYKLIDKRIFSKTVFGILENNYITKKDKKPIIKLILNHPKFVWIILKWRIKKILNLRQIIL